MCVRCFRCLVFRFFRFPLTHPPEGAPGHHTPGRLDYTGKGAGRGKTALNSPPGGREEKSVPPTKPPSSRTVIPLYTRPSLHTHTYTQRQARARPSASLVASRKCKVGKCCKGPVARGGGIGVENRLVVRCGRKNNHVQCRSVREKVLCFSSSSYSSFAISTSSSSSSTSSPSSSCILFFPVFLPLLLLSFVRCRSAQVKPTVLRLQRYSELVESPFSSCGAVCELTR
uniref:Uncharacterized protein n=1 Tax=Anopheles atroparvus TaxID=41427 RepID=A0AAG5DSQ4_ANOAO